MPAYMRRQPRRGAQMRDRPMRRPTLAEWIAPIVGIVLFMAAFSWAALDAEADAARTQAQAECVTDAECEAAYGFDMYGNR